MMKYLQKLGKSLMLPVATLPVAGILMGIGYWIDPTGWGGNSAVAAFLLKAGGAIIDNMAILFAIGVAVGMADDNDGTAALAGLVSWLMLTTLLSTGAVAMFRGIPVEEVPAAFGKTQTQFIGILCGIIGSTCYNKFKNTKLPDFLAFFSGKRSVAIVTAGFTIVAALVLYFVWPIIFGGLVAFGKGILGLGALGAGIYGFLNRLLIPFGLHHALNSVFWFDVAGINDLGNFWSGEGTLGTTGQYMAGFFPVMMFGLPAAALAMYHTAKDNKKKVAAGLLGAAALCSFFTGVTEPLEFAFMFLAPALYAVHALLTGISVALVAMLPARAGFQFSAGLVDFALSFKAPMAQNPLLLLPIGLVFGGIYYAVFRFVITAFNLKTPGREDDDITDEEMNVRLANNDYTGIAATVLAGLGGKSNITSVDNCITRLRLEIKDYTKIDEKKIKSAGVAGVIRPSKNSVQVIVGTQVQFVADEFKKMLKNA
ncbi:N-acetylglucosamine-specific PTS transporter subunit IIBC [Anaerobium acetethylicum]|uniref:PTS system, N-acetylglucosamine-specific IIC component n=1 Tax=Anaerobium acetethylicum TaxID=1619234 RepID=A0A1D3TTF5_9FIRM|nr:N-acetylglucosamine-specific PTS transporter subunit IIBC [Anaerobium acetethylicum]SCP97279.1 PTS system, N-acetylglucosamine-specific IIC component [Anaerobium acetethylicum]